MCIHIRINTLNYHPPHSTLSHKGSCNADSVCNWCVAGAVPSSCFEKANAKKLPSGVFKCDNSDAASEIPTGTCTVSGAGDPSANGVYTYADCGSAFDNPCFYNVVSNLWLNDTQIDEWVGWTIGGLNAGPLYNITAPGSMSPPINYWTTQSGAAPPPQVHCNIENWPFVKGAGIDSVNNQYLPFGSHDDVPMYTHWGNGMRTILFRSLNNNTGTHQWAISFNADAPVPPNDPQFWYYVSTTSGGDIPPTDGWVVGPIGQNPAPQLAYPGHQVGAQDYPVKMWGNENILKVENGCYVDAVTPEAVFDFKWELYLHLHENFHYVHNVHTNRTLPMNEQFYDLNFEFYVSGNDVAKSIQEKFGDFKWLSKKFIEKHGKPSFSFIEYVPNS